MSYHSLFWGQIAANATETRAEVARLQRRLRRSKQGRSRANEELRAEIDTLRGELEFVTLTLTSLLSELDSRGTLTREDLRSVMVEVDGYDGQLDGRLPVPALQELMRPPVLEEILDDEP